MSLINEALKKAQRDRPQMTPAPPPGGPMPPPQPPDHRPKRKPRGFLWGFLLAVVIVGGVSSLLAAFLVLQLLDPHPSPKPVAPEAGVVESAAPAPQPVTTPEPEPESEPEPTVQSNPIPEAEPVASQKAIESTAAVEDPQEPPSNDTSTPVVPADPPTKLVQKDPVSMVEPVREPVVESSPPTGTLPSPEVINRLRNLEIRGVMSGATKVLIYDSSTGKTRVYRTGDPMEDPFGLSIHSISDNSVKFKDYAGHIHTKSF